MSRILVPCALFATGLGILLSVGCDRAQEAPPADSTSPASYMNDADFRGKLDKMRVGRLELEGARERIVDQMKTKVDAAKARLGTGDEKLVKAELEKDPEWRGLFRRCEDLNTAIAEQRKKMFGEVRKRILPKKPISK